MNLERGQSMVNLLQVFWGQYKVGRVDVLLKMLELPRSWDGDDERFLSQYPCQR